MKIIVKRVAKCKSRVQSKHVLHLIVKSQTLLKYVFVKFLYVEVPVNSKGTYICKSLGATTSPSSFTVSQNMSSEIEGFPQIYKVFKEPK